MLDLDDNIARASRAFGALRKPVFRDSSLSLVTKQVVYQAMVLYRGFAECGWDMACQAERY